MAPKQITATKLKLGDRVMLPASKRRGTVVEDQGPLAPDGSQVVGIRMDDTGHLMSAPAEFLERADAEA